MRPPGDVRLTDGPREGSNASAFALTVSQHGVGEEQNGGVRSGLLQEKLRSGLLATFPGGYAHTHAQERVAALFGTKNAHIIQEMPRRCSFAG